MNKALYVDVDVVTAKSVVVDVEEGSHGGILPYYEGTYKVTPSLQEQVLETANKSMKENVEVLQIPVHKFSNASNGHTMVIGGV